MFACTAWPCDNKLIAFAKNELQLINRNNNRNFEKVYHLLITLKVLKSKNISEI